MGFIQAGFRVIWANDNNASACNTYSLNIGGHIRVGDIRKIAPERIPDFDILVAGFPCQSFSIAGKQKGFDDARGTLFFEIARIAKEKKPQVIFLENVSNLLQHDDGKTFLIIYNTLCELGYFVRYLVMTPTVHGNVPHKRERIFIVAFQDYDKCNAFKFPEPVPLERGIADIIDSSAKHSDCYYYGDTDYYYKELLQKVKEKGVLYKIAMNCVFRKPYVVCPTLLASMGRELHRVPIIKDDFGIRRLTLMECLAFQGFPADFKFPPGVSMEDAYKQTGNSVCVPVIKRIAEKIFEVLTH